MGNILAKITDIKNVDNLNILTLDFFGNELKMMSLELKDNVVVGKKVILTTKSTSISFAKEFSGKTSISNILDATIEEITLGELLCSVKLSIANAIFETIITLETFENMDLKTGDNVKVFIKASELSISEVLDG